MNLSALTNVCWALALSLTCATVSGAQTANAPGALPDTAMPSVVEVPAAAQASAQFDAAAATDAYLAAIPAHARAKSDAYFEGGYWLILWDFLFAVAIYILVLRFRWSAGMRNLAERITGLKPLQTAIYWTQFLLVTTAMGAPLAIYEGYFRERQYGLATQTFGGWLGDQLIVLLVNLVLGAVVCTVLFGVVRRVPGSWWIWGAGVSMFFLTFFVMIAPVFIFPLLNRYTVLDNPKITQPILSLARASGISAEKVYTMDASRQTTRMSANVSGFGKTMRITLNDNLLKRGSPEEIQGVMGHEMGHYVLHHIAKDILYFSVVIVIFFAALRWSLERGLARWGVQWQIRGIGDPAILPLVFLVGTLLGFAYTPFLNTHIRTNEHEADLYGLNASRQPDGFAQAAIHLGEFRKMNPGPVEEWIFFDHPSGRNRIHDSMVWKAENLQLFAPKPEH
jgi:STE24 endopeptidase